jgi:mannose-6-phosphate isomerase-like protein (cupin superfamily)
MRKLAIVRGGEVAPEGVHPAAVTVEGLAWSKLMSPPDYGLWLCVAELEAGAQVTWPAEHGDEALYVFDGELSVEGNRCATGGAVIVESGVAATVRATQRTRIGHYGCRTWTPPEQSAAPRGVHVVGPRGRTAFGDPTGLGVRFLADSTCPTCRLSLFEVARDRARQGSPHSHSADEIIFVVEGSMKLGAYELGPGTSLCIPGGVRYAEASGPDGCVFLNYRPHAADRTEFPTGGEPTSRMEDPRAVPGLRLENDVVDVGGWG